MVQHGEAVGRRMVYIERLENRYTDSEGGGD